MKPFAIETSFVIPFFHKLKHWRYVFPYNYHHFSLPNTEVILAVDENKSEKGILDIVRSCPDINFKVIVNDLPHEWRNPAPVINVGLRHSVGKRIIVLSPETIIIGKSVERALTILDEHKDKVYVIGSVVFSNIKAINKIGLQHMKNDFWKDGMPYGFIAAHRNAFFDVCGYNESFKTWGCDDDEIRQRMVMLGYRENRDDLVRVLHVDLDNAITRPHKVGSVDFRHKLIDDLVTGVKINIQGWGQDFSRVAYDYSPFVEKTKFNFADLR